MTVVGSLEVAGPVAPAAAAAPTWRCYRFELRKLVSQWRVRILLVACWIGPGAFVAVVSRQSALPVDTVFGRLMNSTGWAGALVVLAFACLWGLPLLTALVAGDVFAVEDRLGTWRHLMVAVRYRLAMRRHVAPPRHDRCRHRHLPARRHRRRALCGRR